MTIDITLPWKHKETCTKQFRNNYIDGSFVLLFTSNGLKEQNNFAIMSNSSYACLLVIMSLIAGIKSDIVTEIIEPAEYCPFQVSS